MNQCPVVSVWPTPAVPKESPRRRTGEWPHFLKHMFLVLLPPIFGLLVTEFDTSLAA